MHFLYSVYILNGIIQWYLLLNYEEYFSNKEQQVLYFLSH